MAFTVGTSDKVATVSCGWIVEVIVPTVGASVVRRRYIFAVGVDDTRHAERLVRTRLGGLHCTIAARIRLAPGELAQLNVDREGVEELRAPWRDGN